MKARLEVGQRVVLGDTVFMVVTTRKVAPGRRCDGRRAVSLAGDGYPRLHAHEDQLVVVEGPGGVGDQEGRGGHGGKSPTAIP